MKEGKTLPALAEEILRQNETKEDMIVRSQALQLHSNGTSFLEIGRRGSYEMNDIAHGQMAEYLKIPGTYYSRLREQHPSLLDQNVNGLLLASPLQDRRMVRTLDGTARAIVSDRYRRLDNQDLLEVILPDLTATPGLELASCEVTERKLYLKVTTARIQAEVVPGDVVQAGVMISNSEVGLGAVSVLPYSVRLVCMNGAVHTDYGTKKNHVGRYVTDSGEDAYQFFADETLIADDKAFFLKVRDVVRAALSEDTFSKMLEPMREAAGAKLEGDPVEAVEVLSKKHGLNNDEKNSVLRNLIEGHDLSLWGLANAVTAASQKVESYDRATELEQLGGRIITLSKSEYRELQTAA